MSNFDRFHWLFIVLILALSIMVGLSRATIDDLHEKIDKQEARDE